MSFENSDFTRKKNNPGNQKSLNNFTRTLKNKNQKWQDQEKVRKYHVYYRFFITYGSIMVRTFKGRFATY